MKEINAALIKNIEAALELRPEIGASTGDILASVSNEVIPILKQPAEEQEELSSGQDKLRAVMLGKMDGIQETVDMLRQDIRNAWRTADFAISNSRNAREDTEKLLDLISTMQTQHQLLASQVELLRRAAAKKDDGA